MALLPAAGALAGVGRRGARAFRRLRIVEWSLLHWYAALGLAWGVLLIVYPPTGPAMALGTLFYVVASLAILGWAVASAGTVLTAQRDPARGIGMLVEAWGITVIQAANLCYLFAQLGLATAPLTGRDRIALCAYAYAVTASLFVRGLFLVSQYRKVGQPAGRKVIA